MPVICPTYSEEDIFHVLKYISRIVRVEYIRVYFTFLEIIHASKGVNI